MIKSLTIAIVTYNRRTLFENLLLSIRKSLLNIEIDVELVVAINGPCEYTNILDRFDDDFTSINTFVLNETTPAKARNRLIDESTSDYILFLDDDTLVDESYLTNLVELINQNPSYVIFGGHDKAYHNVSDFELALNLALRSPMLTFNTRARHCPVESGDARNNLTLANLTVSRYFLNKHNIRFDEDYMRNEENILIHKVLGITDKIMYSTNLSVSHKRRSSVSTFLLPAFYSGYYRMRSMYEQKDELSFSHLVPILFFILNIIFIILCPKISFFTILGYLILVFISTLRISIEESKPNLIPLVFILHPIIIMSYVLGQLKYVYFSR